MLFVTTVVTLFSVWLLVIAIHPSIFLTVYSGRIARAMLNLGGACQL